MIKSVVCKNLSKVFGDVAAVDNISLEIDQGEFIVLLGPSGSGKTTLLRMIAGLERPTDGEIYINENYVNNWSAKERNIAMVFQDYALYPYKTVHGNLAFPLRNQRVPSQIVDQKVKETSKMLGIDDLLDRKPGQLSGGQRQRVAVGRAIIREPSVFLMDEPLSNLDAKLRVEMRAELLALHERLRTTFIYVTHDQVEAMTMGERIAVLDEGKIEQIGTPEEVYRKPANRKVAEFVGTPSINILQVHVTSNREELIINDVAFPLSSQLSSILPKGEDTFDLGIRPEHILVYKIRDENAFKEYVLRVKGRVLFREALGHEDIIYVDIETGRIAVRTEGGEIYQAGDEVTLAFDLDRACFFRASGEVIVSDLTEQDTERTTQSN